MGTEFYYLKLENCKRFEGDALYSAWAWRQAKSEVVGELMKTMKVTQTVLSELKKIEI